LKMNDKVMILIGYESG